MSRIDEKWLENQVLSRLRAWKSRPQLMALWSEIDEILEAAKEAEQPKRTVLSKEPNTLDMEDRSNPRISRAPTIEQTEINDLTCANGAQQPVFPDVDDDGWPLNDQPDEKTLIRKMSQASYKADVATGQRASHDDFAKAQFEVVKPYLRATERELGDADIEAAAKACHENYWMDSYDTATDVERKAAQQQAIAVATVWGLQWRRG